MTARLTEILFDSVDPLALATFWAAVLGWEVPELDDDGEAEIVDPQGVLPSLLFLPTSDPKPTDKNRLHIDVNPIDTDQATELERLLGLGATHVDIGQFEAAEPVSWVVLADPEGNEFCLLHSTVH